MTLGQMITAASIIKRNRAIQDSGEIPVACFVSKDVEVADPFLDESGRFEVNPFEHYGSLFTDWVSSLAEG